MRRAIVMPIPLTLALVLLTTAAVYLSTPAYAQEAPTRWQPAPGISWQWQLSGTPVDTSFNVGAYDIDGFDNDAAVVDKIHAKNAKAICYISAGSWENWRPDAGDFPASVKGQSNGWPGERWLDIRRVDVLQPIMEHRMDMCLAKGFDAVEPDNIDGYANSTGFPITYNDQLRYNRMLAQEAHERGLAIALKNDTDQVADLVDYFDFAIVEECYTYEECPAYSPFVQKNKAVLAAEYNTQSMSTKCADAKTRQFSLIFKNRDLDAQRSACDEPPAKKSKKKLKKKKGRR